ncbi:RNA polymerase sigma-70 factor (ECF subfamily) [Saccharothrix tamanrassetensis]|uniref:RNA polymerase sigma-70 factor (ECF subfamily) n=1 Tax=Saccharothrix tamanrassetensis TaxID=1051531 RepID=A0A841CK07_9PSEU|nr:sigma-70 family RNA polymerase sigma factor [Saccharothrix tamanrassetensis]MBB5957831.1 RNA polymerase sigma-70 factor (ECF subfamily) [Saccharothrix tamanrassetensis]
MTAAEQTLAATFTEHRSHLIGVAYRLTGSVADAEDAVQEAWLRLTRLSGQAREEIRELRGWLTTVVGRICLDRLRSAAVRREKYVGQWLPEPLVTSWEDDPLEAVVRDDGVRMAALVVLDRLTPEQRVAFVLHDAFGVPFESIAETLGCTVATARQHASRGRRAASDAPPPPRVALDEQREVLERFVAALASGDVDAVVGLLHPDVTVVGDGGGKARTAINTVSGADKVSRFILGLMRRYEGLPGGEPVLVNGDLGIKFRAQGNLAARVSTFVVRDGKVAVVYDFANPDKLGHVRF